MSFDRKLLGSIVLIFQALTFLSNSAFGQENDTIQPLPESLRNQLENVIDLKLQESNERKLLEIDGLVIDETITKIGRDFFDKFYSSWEAPKGATDFQITVIERPLPGIGAQVVVKLNDDEVFEQFLQPREDIIEAAANYAIGYLTQYLLDYENIKKNLEGDDMTGSGIF